MKSAIVDAPGQLTVREVPEPAIGEYQCLCETLFGATCSGTDTHLIEGHPMPFPYSHPLLLGHESIGRVIEVGPKVSQFKVGDLVTRVINGPIGPLASYWGGFSERTIAADHQAMKADGLDPGFSEGIHQILPQSTDPAAATMIITWRETFSYIKRIGVHPGQGVLIIGSGANGLAFANHARNLGAEVVAMTGSPDRREAAEKVGVSIYASYKQEPLADLLRDKGLAPVELIIDAVGKAGQLDRVLPLLKPGGKIAIYGVDEFGQVAITPTLAGGEFTWVNSGYNEGEAHQAVMTFMQEGKLRAEDYCDLENIYLLDRIADAYSDVQQRRITKAIINVNHSHPIEGGCVRGI